MSGHAVMATEDDKTDQHWDPNERYKDVKVAQEYDRIRFNSLAGRVFNALERRCILKAFRSVPKEARIIDMPCGTGRLAEVLLEEGFNVVGVDISPAMLEVARRRLARFGDRFVTRVADARALGAEGKQYDVALCARILMHFPLEEQISFLKGVVAVTQGLVVITQSLNTPYHRARRGLKRMLGHQTPVRFPITNSEVRMLLDGAGLHEIARYRVLSAISEAATILSEPTNG